MRTTLNISEEVMKEAEELYKANSKSAMVENALKDAIRFKKMQELMKLKGKIEFDEEAIENLRSAEIAENKNNS
ncbi:type II toxin-antitoxin system VapB family antitoxin [Fuchsiella alkaliacetigena]|uniref:type II toxin-antitoxin system VapB family antitoxin n=1 Tax=Fuchsiella alkaliacetigena TaxID=957042 RepID=UPI00200A38E5|nr:type II toxin-antitoxin system VapB family antitoxin [Fuchsiella alkaliacetigena]MCK8825702.1 type II toxin-antitoxin system VapB family antitoxin [Fuchsiella alkaliacetigena]